MSQRIFSASDFQDPPTRGSRSGGGSVAARIVGALIGLIVTGPALLLVMTGGSRAYAQTLVQARTEPAIGAIVLAAVGLVLLLVVVLSGLLSAAAPFVGGIIATGAAVAFLVAPGPVLSAMRAVPGLGVDSVNTMTLWGESGLLLVVGVVLLASALARVLAARSGARRASGPRALVSIVVAVVATAGGLALMVVGSAALLRASATSGAANSVDVPSLLLLAGAIMLGAVALTSAWSSVGSAIVGGLLLVFGVAGFLPVVVLGVFDAMGSFSGDVAGGASTVVAVGFVAVLGVVYLGAAASAARARRAGR